MAQVLNDYLQSSFIVDFEHPSILAKAKELKGNSNSDVEIAKSCFTFVRDHIRHTGDHKDAIITCKAKFLREEFLHGTFFVFFKYNFISPYIMKRLTITLMYLKF